MKVKLVPQKPQVPTAAGTMTPAAATNPGSQFASAGGQGVAGSASSSAASSGQSAMAANAKAAAAGT
jgi:hypothetical protein